MGKFVCTVCGFIYDEAQGLPDQGIAPGTRWEDVPGSWMCPVCGASQDDFTGQATAPGTASDTVRTSQHLDASSTELSFGELSALCSNLSKGCEKQYRPEEADLFAQLAGYFAGKRPAVKPDGLGDLADLIQDDLSSGYPQANDAAAAQSDRGALRALVWSEKVTRILSSLLNRFDKQQDALVENTNVYVCEICGFVFVGDTPPDICPICKVPNLKIRSIEKEAV